MLISEDYKAQQVEMHNTMPHYGMASVKFAPEVTKIIDKYDVKEMLDYGSGKGRLSESIKPGHPLDICQYDPGMEDIDEPPGPSELVCCIDVLEHIEPELIDNVLDDLKRCTIRLGYFTIHTGPAGKVLPDGRNAHLIQQPFTWWMPKIEERFAVLDFSHRAHGFCVLCGPL